MKTKHKPDTIDQILKEVWRHTLPPSRAKLRILTLQITGKLL